MITRKLFLIVLAFHLTFSGMESWGQRDDSLANDGVGYDWADDNPLRYFKYRRPILFENEKKSAGEAPFQHFKYRRPILILNEKRRYWPGELPQQKRGLLDRLVMLQKQNANLDQNGYPLILGKRTSSIEYDDYPLHYRDRLWKRWIFFYESDNRAYESQILKAI